jgi:hypothetical protein
MSQEERSIFWEVGHGIGHSKQKYVYVHVFYSERFPRYSYLLYSSKIVDKKEILGTVSNIGIYCSSDRVGTATRVRTWRVACVYSVQCTVRSNSSISETVRNSTHVHIHLFRMTDTMASQNIDLTSGDTLYLPSAES